MTWVVDNLDQTIREWQKLGISSVHERGIIDFPEAIYRGSPVRVRVRSASTRLGNVTIDWYQPVEGKNAFTDFLAKHGNGVFSLVHRVPSAEALRMETQRLSRKGVSVLQKASMKSESGTMSFTYFDTETEGKYVLGLVYFPGPAESQVEATPARNVVQYAFVVQKVQPVLEYWEKLGFADISVTHPALWDLRYHDQPGRFDAKLGWQRDGRIIYEWIEPLRGPTVYLDHVKKHGEGFHHFALQVEDIDSESARWASLGFQFLQGGAWGERNKPGYGRFAYQDAESIGGIDVELLWNFK